MAVVETQRIEKSSEKFGGKACIIGHRIRVADIVVWHLQRGYSPDEVLGFFPGLTLSQVHAALAYYFDHRDEIDNEIRLDENAAARMPNGRSKLLEKLSG